MHARRLESLEVVLVLLLTSGVYFYEHSLGPGRGFFFDLRYGAVPAAMWEAWQTFRESGWSHEVMTAALPLVTANYLHANVAHLGSNMLFFWIFGNVVSQAAGRALFLLLYLVSGMIAVLVYVRTNPGSEVPMVGASGAIAGLEGAYFALMLRWELPNVHVWPLEGPVQPARLALVALINFALDSSAFFGRARDTVAYGAHVGGFLGGAMLAMVIASVAKPAWQKA